VSIKNDVLFVLAQQVARDLPGTWVVTPFPEDWGRAGAHLRETQSQAILILGESQEYSDRKKNRLTVQGDYPRDRHGHMSSARRPKISVSGEKTGSQIAAEIARRLLPEYLPLLVKELAQNTRSNEQETQTKLVAEQIAHLVRVPIRPGETQVLFYESPYKIFQATMSGASVPSDDEVEITLRLVPDVALKLLNQIVHGRFELPESAR
jgi:hypothetical protein